MIEKSAQPSFRDCGPSSTKVCCSEVERQIVYSRPRDALSAKGGAFNVSNVPIKPLVISAKRGHAYSWYRRGGVEEVVPNFS